MTAENIYGHNKKLMFILNAIKSYSEIHKKSLTEIIVLDFGCGNAVAVSSKIAELGINLTGIDFHEESIKFAIKNNKFKTAEFILGDEDIASGLNQKYDIIVYSDIVEHLPDPQSTLKKISKIHNNNGIVIISIPNGFGPFEI